MACWFRAAETAPVGQKRVRKAVEKKQKIIEGNQGETEKYMEVVTCFGVMCDVPGSKSLPNGMFL